VLRERDGAVLWLDLEMAKVKWKDVRPEDFDDMAKFEFRGLFQRGGRGECNLIVLVVFRGRANERDIF